MLYRFKVPVFAIGRFLNESIHMQCAASPRQAVRLRGDPPGGQLEAGAELLTQSATRQGHVAACYLTFLKTKILEKTPVMKH